VPNDVRFEAAAREAEQLIHDRRLLSLPIDPFAIAEASEIVVEPMPPYSDGVSGILCKVGDNFGILYATYIDNEGFQRFSVAHELGHYFLPGHIDHLFDEGKTQHRSRSGFVSIDPYELEADHFASSLLMPRRLFAAEMFKAGEGLAAIEHLAGVCRTSLTATAIRYAQLTEKAVAVVVSTDARVDYCFMSEAFRAVRGLEWLRKGSLVPPGTPTHAFGEDQSRIACAQRIEECSNVGDWFGGRRDVELNEDVIGLGRYGKILTVLYSEALENDDEDDNNDHEWEPPRFRRSRRR
jgi:Zn-dependent peptidase ImmA (M78 family)